MAELQLPTPSSRIGRSASEPERPRTAPPFGRRTAAHDPGAQAPAQRVGFEPSRRVRLPRDRWKRTRRTFYALIIASLFAMLTSVDQLHWRERAIAQQQRQIDERVQESQRWLSRMVAVETVLLAVNGYGIYRGFRFAMLLKRIRFRVWVDSIRAQLPFVRGVGRVVRATDRAVRALGWPVRAPMRRLREARCRRAALKAAELARVRAPRPGR